MGIVVVVLAPLIRKHLMSRGGKTPSMCGMRYSVIFQGLFRLLYVCYIDPRPLTLSYDPLSMS